MLNWADPCDAELSLSNSPSPVWSDIHYLCSYNLNLHWNSMGIASWMCYLWGLSLIWWIGWCSAYFLISANIVTGLCPTGFISATYGVGSCYIVYKEMQQMGQAVLNCRDNHAATIVSIETELEENFIKSLVANVTGEIQFPPSKCI